MGEFQKYLDMCEQGTSAHRVLQFWQQQSSTLPRIHEVAVRSLAVPDTSAAVERVFSSGDMFMRPHRARLSNKALSDLVFLKCNIDML